MTPPAPPTNGYGWFRVDNAVLDRIAVIGLTAACVYLVLARYANNDTRTCYVGVETIAKTLRLTPQAVRNSIKRLVTAQMIVVEHRQHEGGRSLTNLYRLLDLAPQDQAQPTLSLPDGGSTWVEGEGQRGLRGEGQPTLSQRILLEEEHFLKKTPSPRKLRFEEADTATAKWMFAKIHALDASQREPNFDSWSNAIRLIREQDRRTDEEIRGLFTWANQDTFWRTNILSPGKLREKWNQLSIKKKAGTNGNGRQLHPTGNGQRHPADRDRPGF